MQRDLVNDVKFLSVEAIAVTAASVPTEELGTAIDTKECRAIAFGVNPTSALTSGDEVYLKIYECDTSGGTYTEIDSAKYISNVTSNQMPIAGTLIQIGCFSTKRYVKIAIDADVQTADETYHVSCVQKLEQRPSDVDTLDTEP